MTFRQVLVGTDFSDSSQCAIALAATTARQFEANLTLMHCWEAPSITYATQIWAPIDLTTQIEAAALDRLAQALNDLKEQMPNAKSVLRCGVPWEEIIAAAVNVHADLIVVGTHGRRGLRHALLGSVAEKVVRMATVPVLTVHGPVSAFRTGA